MNWVELLLNTNPFIVFSVLGLGLGINVVWAIREIRRARAQKT
jgi:F0F1-type ATP synthase assembly protein I